MEVVEKGKKWIAKKRCDGSGYGCGALLLVEEEDIYYDIYGSCDDSYTVYYFKCPECGLWNRINEYDLPPKVKRIALNKCKENLVRIK